MAQQKNVVIDGININASHVASFDTKEKAIADMISQGYVPGNTKEEKEKWAADAYPKIIQAAKKTN